MAGAAACAGLFAAVAVGGLIIPVAAAGAAGYVATRSDGVGDAARTTGNAAVSTAVAVWNNQASGTTGGNAGSGSGAHGATHCLPVQGMHHGYSGGTVAVCNTKNCSRATWNKRPGEQCCRSCKLTGGSRHGPCCEAAAAGSSADSKKRKWDAASPAAKKNPRVDKAPAAASSPSQPPPHGPPTSRPEIFYHGTSLEAAMDIQKNGFDVRKSGSNAGMSLGRGLYVTTTLEKALNYAKRTPCKGAIFEL